LSGIYFAYQIDNETSTTPLPDITSRLISNTR
jgi:hypothetical protein